MPKPLVFQRCKNIESLRKSTIKVAGVLLLKHYVQLRSQIKGTQSDKKVNMMTLFLRSNIFIFRLSNRVKIRVRVKHR